MEPAAPRKMERGVQVSVDLTEKIPQQFLDDVLQAIEQRDVPNWLEMQQLPASHFETKTEYLGYRQKQANEESRPVAIVFRVNAEAPDPIQSVREKYENGDLYLGPDSSGSIEGASLTLTAYITQEGDVMNPSVIAQHKE